MPGFDGRHATQRARRTRVAGVIVLVLAVIGVLVYFFGSHVFHHTAAPRRHPVHHVAVPKVVTSLVPWRLSAPISRAVVLAGATPGGNSLEILGGATTGGLTASGAFALDVSTGTLSQVGDLATTLDNAAGAVLDGQDVVFGGTPSASASATASVQALSDAAPTGAPATALPASTSLGSLPAPRSDDTSALSGSTAYLVGGDNASGPDPTILATTDGRHFTVVASLKLPVLFPAVAVLGNELYVFGGVADAGPDAGHPVNTIQVVDLRTHKVTDTGHLPEPLAGAAAIVLGHDIFVAGGDSTAPASRTSTSTTTTSTTTTSTTPAGSAAPTSGPTTSTVSTVWSYDPTSGTSTTVGHLFLAVSHAGVAVLGSTAWLVGGEANGTPVSSVQNLVVAPS
jgi:hypothetical protein